MVITEIDKITEKSASTSQSQPLNRHFDVGDPNFDISCDLKYPHVPNTESFPVDLVGSSVPTSIF